MLGFTASALGQSATHHLSGMGSQLPASLLTGAWALGPAPPSPPCPLPNDYYIFPSEGLARHGIRGQACTPW